MNLNNIFALFSAGKLNILTLLALFLFFISANCYGQNSSRTVIKGHVLTVSGEPIEGATILIKDKNKGTVTNGEGEFILVTKLTGNQIIQVSTIGFNTQTKMINIKDGQDVEFNFRLQETSYLINEIQLTGKSEIRKINEQAYEVTSVSTQKLLNSTADAQQIIDRVPGVRVLQNGGLGSNYTFSLNGFKGNQVKFFLNGIPMDSFGTSFNLSNIPVNSIERIDVYNGVVPVWLGTDALGGAVNIITNQKDEYFDISYSIGSFNTHQASINGAFTNDDTGFTVRGNLNYNYSDNNYNVLVDIFDANGNILQENVETERFHNRYQSAIAHIETGFVDRSFADQLLLGLIVSGDDSENQTGATMATVFGAVETESESYIPTLKYKKQNFFIDGLDASLSSAYNITQTKNIDTLTGIRYNWYGETYQTNSETNAEQGDANLLDQDDREFSTQFNLSYLISKKQSISLNYAFQHFSRDEYDHVNLDRNAYYFPKSLSKNVFGISYKYNLTKDWTTTLFGKAYMLNVNTSHQEGNTLETTNIYKVNYEDFGYGLATSYHLFQNLQFKASYEKAFRLPTAQEFFGDGLVVLANPDLKPEQSDNFNFGAKYSYNFKSDHLVEIGGTFVYRNTKDLIYNIVSVTGPTTKNGNLTETRAVGVQGNLGYYWGNKFHLSTNITYQDITDQAALIYNDYSGYQENFNKGARIPNTPYLFGSATAGLNFENVIVEATNIFFNYYYRFTQEYFLSSNRFGNAESKAIIPQQNSHSVELGYSVVNGKYNISIECRNLTDQALYDKFRLQKPGRAFYLKLRYNL